MSKKQLILKACKNVNRIRPIGKDNFKPRLSPQKRKLRKGVSDTHEQTVHKLNSQILNFDNFGDIPENTHNTFKNRG